MVDIRIGGLAAPPGVGATPADAGRPAGFVEARLLALRPPRKTRDRDRTGAADPADGRVLVLLVPDASRLPPGLETGSYRVLLRFAPR